MRGDKSLLDCLPPRISVADADDRMSAEIVRLFMADDFVGVFDIAVQLFIYDDVFVLFFSMHLKMEYYEQIFLAVIFEKLHCRRVINQKQTRRSCPIIPSSDGIGFWTT